MFTRSLPLLLTAIVVAGCKNQTKTTAELPTITVGHGDINVRVAATGVVEPITSRSSASVVMCVAMDWHYVCLTAAISLTTESLASPNSIVVCGSR